MGNTGSGLRVGDEFAFYLLEFLGHSRRRVARRKKSHLPQAREVDIEGAFGGARSTSLTTPTNRGLCGILRR